MAGGGHVPPAGQAEPAGRAQPSVRPVSFRPAVIDVFGPAGWRHTNRPKRNCYFYQLGPFYQYILNTWTVKWINVQISSKSRYVDCRAGERVEYI